MSILKGEIPMSKRRAKELLLPHAEEYNLFDLALAELNAIETPSKAIRTAARQHLINAILEINQEQKAHAQRKRSTS